MGKEKLKDILLAIREDNYSVPQGIKPYELSLEMMNYIGDTDDELRDDLILSNYRSGSSMGSYPMMRLRIYL